MKTICLILKAPREGTVKTRLARDVGPGRATAIYRALVEHQVRSIPPGWVAAIHFAPSDAEREMREWLKPLLPASARFVPQCAGDLGCRLANVVSIEFQRGAGRVFLIGGDCPGLSQDYLVDADRQLTETDIVVGPATDGGYVLLGLKTPHVALFEDIAWSTPAVLEQTLAAAGRLRLPLRLLPALEDIDDVASLERQSRFKDLGIPAISTRRR
jgi:rSAM/selenodomain-associated transferase 1